MDDIDDTILAAQFDELRYEMAGRNTPPGVEKELMLAFARQFPRRRWYHRFATPGWSIGASFASAALVALLFTLAPGSPGHPPGAALPQVAVDNGTAFIALESLDRIAREPDPRLVTTEVPRTALAPLGLPVSPEDAGGSVKAEMLLAADGELLALRLSSID
jgi:hypothetical protein